MAARSDWVYDTRTKLPPKFVERSGRDRRVALLAEFPLTDSMGQRVFFDRRGLRTERRNMRWKKEPKQECMHSFRLEAEATVVDTTGTRRPCDYAKVQTHKCVYCSKRENRFIDPLG